MPHWKGHPRGRLIAPTLLAFLSVVPAAGAGPLAQEPTDSAQAADSVPSSRDDQASGAERPDSDDRAQGADQTDSVQQAPEAEQPAATTESPSPPDSIPAQADQAPDQTDPQPDQADSEPPPSGQADAWTERVASFSAGVQEGTLDRAAGSQLLESLSDEIAGTRQALLAALNDRDAERATPHDADLLVLHHARDSLLAVLPDSTQVRLFAMGRDGLDQVAGELQFFWLHSRFETLAVRATVESIFLQLINSPLGWLRQFLKIALAVLVFVWWRRSGAKSLVTWRKRLIEIRPIRRQNVRLAKALWYFDRIRPPLEWLVLIAGIVTVSAARDFGPALFVWAIAKWVLIGWTAVLLVDAFAARSPAARRDQTGLRRRSLWMLCRWIVAYGLGRQLVRDFFGQGALFHWITSVLMTLLALVVLLLVVWWRKEVPQRLDSLPVRPRFIDALLTRREGIQRYLTSLVGGAYLIFDGVRRAFVRVLANSDLGRRGLAHLTRSEIARQALKEKALIQGVPISEDLQRRLLNGDAPLIDKVGRATVNRLIELLDSHIGTVAGLVGERGSGKTRTVERLSARLDKKVLSVQCPFGTCSDLETAVAKALDLPPDADTSSIGAALQSTGIGVVVVDDIHRLARPVIGGREDLDSIRDMLRAAGPLVSWVLTIDATAWEYIRRFREEEPLHHHIVRLDPWGEEEIGRLIRSRSEAADIDPDFSHLVLPRQLDDGSYDSPAMRNQASFFRILWDDSDGNPEAALRLWTDSLVLSKSGKPLVRLPYPPKASELEGVGVTLLFVLRTLLRLEQATAGEIAQCLPVGLAQVEDNLLFARSKGMLDVDVDGHVSISWRWDRAVRRALARRNMTS